MAKSYSSIKAGWVNPNVSNIGKKKSYKDIKASDYDFGVDDKYITSFIEDSQSHLKKSQDNYDKVGYNNAKTAYESNLNSSVDLRERANTIRAYINANKGSLDAETYSNLTSYLDAYGEDSKNISMSYKNKFDYISQFEDEDAYNRSYDNVTYSKKYAKSSYADLQKAKADIEAKLTKNKDDETLNRELYWLQNHDTDVQFIDSMSTEELEQYKKNYDTKSKELETNVKNLRNTKRLLESSGATNDAYYTTVCNDLTAAENALNKFNEENRSVLYTDEDGAGITADILLNMRAAEKKFGIEGIASEDLEKDLEVINRARLWLANQQSDATQTQLDYENSSPQAKADMEYLKEKYNINDSASPYDVFEAVKDLEEYANWNVAKSNFADKQKKDAEYASEHPYLATGKAILSAPLTVFELADNILRESNFGKDEYGAHNLVNVYDDKHINRNATYQSTVSGMVGDYVMDKTDSELLSWLASGAYSGITSSAQSALTTGACTLMFGAAGAPIALGIMGTEAAASSYNNAIMNGSTNGEAILTAVSSGIAEAAFEKISLDKLIDIGKMYDVSSMSALLKSMVKNSGAAFVQGGVEASEEFFTEITNKLADEIINGDHSAYNTAVAKYKKMGYSDTDAKDIATKDAMLEIVEALYGGFIGGIGSGAGASLTQGTRATRMAIGNEIRSNQYYNLMGKNIVANEGIQDLVGKAQEIPEFRKLANKVAGVNTTELTDKKGVKKFEKQVGKLYKGVTEAQLKELSKTNASETEVNSFTELVKEELKSKGVDNVDKVAEVIVKSALNDGKLTREESTIYNSVNGRAVINKVLSSEDLKVEEGSALEQVKNEINSTRDLGKFDVAKAIKRDLLDKTDYDISTDGVTTIQATDEAVDSMLITSLDGDDITLDAKVGDAHHTVVAGELTLNQDYAVIFEGLKNIKNKFGLDESTANKILTLWEGHEGDSFKFSKAIEEGFMYGQYNMRTEFENSAFAEELSEETRNKVFEMGREYKQKVTDEKNASAQTEAKADIESKVTFAEGVSYNKLTKMQKAQVDMAQVIAHTFGFNLEIFRSPKNILGKSIGENGSYSASTNTMRLDIDAGTLDGKSLILFTQAHELTHFIKKWSPEKYKVFADFLVEKYAEKDVPLKQLIQQKINNSKIATENDKTGRHHVLTFDEAFDEVVCNACEDFLADPNIQQTILEISKVDQSIAQKIKNFIKNLINRLDKALRGLQGESLEAGFVRGLDADDIQQLKDLWLVALIDSRENVVESKKRTIEEQNAIEAFGDDIGTVETNENGDVTLISNEDGSTLMWSERTWFNGGKDALIEALTRNEHTQEEISDTIKMVEDSLDYLKLLAAGDAEMRGYTELANHLVADIMTDVVHGKQVLYSIVNNGDYPVNLDLALICKKRVAYMRLMSRLIEDGVMEDVRYDGDAIASVNEILRKNGFETACLGCFVESRRLQFQTWAETIVQEWNGEVDRRNKTAGDFNYTQNAITDASSLTDEELAHLEAELKSKKKNKQGNINLGQGSVRTKMGKLLDEVPTLQKHISVADLLTPEGITKLRAENPNLFSLVKSRYGAASPKIVQNYNPYSSEIANLTFKSVENITTNAVKGSQEYIARAEEELSAFRPAKPKKSMSDTAFNKTKEKSEWDAKVQTLAMRKYLFDIGGARMQSFSDFMIENVFDYLQMFADLSANRFPLHSYTKEAAFLRLFGMTGAKINGSLIAHVDRKFGKQYAGLLPAEEAKNGNAILVHTADGDFAIGFDDYARHMATKGTDGETYIQSIGMKDIIALQMDKRYSANVGSITIGVSDVQILAMLDSPLFRMVIPYHASGMLPQFAKLVGVDLYNDYTDYQNTTVRQYYDLNKMPLSDEVDENGKTKQGTLRDTKGDSIKADTSYSFNAELQKIGDPKQVANNYIKWCNEFHEIYDGDTLVGYAKFNPKFSNSPYGTDFTKHENYYKLLEDFNVYDGITEQYAQQGAVQMIFPSADTRLSSQEIEEYKQRLRDTGIFNEKEIEKYAQKANMTFDELVKAEVKNRIAYEDEQNPKFDSTVKEIEEELLKSHKRTSGRIKSYDEFKKLKDSDSKASKEALKNMKPMTRTYFQDRDSTGRELSPGQAEFFKDSKVRDADGNLLVVYHGTDVEFTVFDKTKGRSSMDIQGSFFSPWELDAKGYGQNVKAYYLNITNPASEGIAYKALNKFKGQNYAGIKAREYLESLGYDGVNNGDEEYIAFNSNQIKAVDNLNPTENEDIWYSDRVTDKETLDFLNEQISKGEYDATTNTNGGYYVTYKSMSFWGYDGEGNAILRSPMAEYVDGKLSDAYLMPTEKGKFNWYKATENIDEGTGLPKGLLVKTRLPGRKSDSYLPASENQELINDDWSNLYFMLKKKILENGKWKTSDVPARYNPYEHSSNLMLNDQFKSAYLRDNLVTVKMYVPVSEDNGTYRAKWSKDATGWAEWKSGDVAGKINKQKNLQRNVYLSRYAAPVEIVPDSEVAQAYKEYIGGTDVDIPDNVVSPSLLKELKKIGVPIKETGLVNKEKSRDDSLSFQDRNLNEATFNGKEFWSGSVSLIDGIIEEVHSFEEAEAVDFHHSLYFSQAQVEKMASGENAFFFIDGGKVEGDWRESVPKNIIKKIEEQITFNTDIAYQDRPYQPSLEDLGIDFKEENEKLKADIERLQEVLKLQGTVTHGKALATKAYEGVAKKLLHEFGMKRVTDGEMLDTFIKKLDKFYYSIIDADELAWEQIFNDAQEIAEWVDSKIVEKPKRIDYADEILKEIRSIKISLDDAQMQEVAYAYGSYNAFRKSSFGRINLSNDGIKLDSQWSEWANAYPWVFDADTNSADMPTKLVEIINDLKTAYEITEEYDKAEQIRSMATAIYDSYWDIPTVRTLADKHQKEVNLLKGKHKAEMDALKEKKDAKLKDTKAYYQKMVEKVRADKDAKMKAYKERTQEQRKKNLEGRTKTATKNKIKRVVKQLESLYSNPTKEKNVKIEFQDMVNKALIMADAIFDSGNMSAYDVLSGKITISLGTNEKKKLDEWREVYKTRQDYQDKLDALESSAKVNQKTHDDLLDMINRCNGKLNRLGRELSDVVERQKAELNNNSVKNAIGSLVEAYKSLDESTESYVKAAYNDYVATRLETLKESLKGTTAKTMSLTQLDELYQAYKMVLTSVRTANELFVKNKRLSVIDAGESVISEVKKAAKITEEKAAILKELRNFSWQELKPVYAFERIGSQTFMDLYKEVLRGQGIFARDIEDSKDFFQDKNKAYGYDSWDLEKRKDFRLADGRTFSISLQEIMSIYAYSKREQALDHITDGGFVFDTKEFFTDNREKGLKGKIKKQRTTVKAYRLNIGEFQQIIDSLTKEQKKFVDDMQDYLSSVMGAKGNEVSRVLYGIDLFKEKFYFPLMSSHDFITQTNNPAGEVALKNTGMAKATVPHARNPIVLKGFMDVWSEHVNKMSTYHSFVLPIENLNKVFNYTGYATSDDSVSVETILRGAYGDSVNDYIRTFIQDLNGGVKVQGSGNWVMKAINKFKKTAVAASMSVVIQQPTAIVRALAMMDMKYFFHKTDGMKHKDAWEELKKYAPVAIIKEMGGFDVGGGKQVAEYITAKEYKGIKAKAKGLWEDSTYRDESLMYGASKADEFGWITIWNAVKKEIADTTTHQVGSEEFLQACGERFTEVIDYTQVYDSVISRSGFMRNKGEISKMATSFMGEPTTSFNMLYNAVLQAKRGNIGKGEMAKIMGATISSIILASIAKSLIYALRDDDEDESYIEKYFQALTDSLISDMHIHNMLPYINDIVSIFSGWDVERTDMAILKDFKDAIDGLDSSEKSLWRKVEDLAGAVAAFGGFPLKNVMRTVREMYNFMANLFDDNVASGDDVGDAIVETITGEKSASDINEALEKGNTAKAKEIIKDLIADKVEGGKTEKEAKASIKSSVTGYWKDLYLQAYRDNNSAEMLRIRQILQSTGLYDNVIETCQSWVKSMKKETTTDTKFKKW